MQDPNHRFSEIKNFEDSDKYTEREKTALRYADAILWNPDLAGDDLWEQLYAHFTEPEIVELGYWIGFTSGGQRWLHTLETRQGELTAAIAERQTVDEGSEKT